MTKELQAAVEASDAIFFDGTFWGDGELGNFRPGARTAKQMHHLPVSDGSLEFLRSASARRKIYIHINNTNPILDARFARTRCGESSWNRNCVRWS